MENDNINLPNEVINTQEKKRKQRNILESFYYGNVQFKREFITNTDMEKEFYIYGNDLKFVVEIKYDKTRGKWQAHLTFEEKRQSLSFFPTEHNAFNNVMTNITYRIGAVALPTNNSNLGD